jgi:glyoxylase-like metal-dependent hydrolase (beta-lactamase superfamily II)
VHGYGALWQLQDELAPPVVAIGVDDLQWTKAFRVTWPTDDRHELAPGLVMHRSGGHFPGHTVLHDERRGILFVGDLLKVDLEGETPVGLSCHKAYHAQIPLSHAEIRQARALVERLEFDAVATPFEFAAPVSTKQVMALFDRQLAGQPIAGPVPLAELG